MYHAFAGTDDDDADDVLDTETGEPARKEFAIKVYKTSILVFRDRDRYVNGEFRFRKV